MQSRKAHRDDAKQAPVTARAPRRRLAHLGVAIACLLSSSCLVPYRLEPAAGGEVAQGSGIGVDIKADGDSWEGSSITTDHSIPIWVEITNHTDEPLRVRYTDWAVVREGNRGNRGIPAIDLHPGLEFPEPDPGGNANRHWIAPSGYRQQGGPSRGLHYARRAGVWYRGPLSRTWLPVGQLRTRNLLRGPVGGWDMLRFALGEGELRPGETRAGYVYFPKSAKRGPKFKVAWLVHNAEGDVLGAVGVSFRARPVESDGHQVNDLSSASRGSGLEMKLD